MRKLIITLVTIFGTLVLILAATGFYTFKIFPDNALAKAKKQPPVDAIIVPGYPFREGQWSDLMKARIYWSRYLFENNYTNNIIYSGSAVYTPYVESEIMALYAEKLGIPSDSIYTETKAEHSTENLYYSYQLAQEKGFFSVALATDPVQSLMLIPFANQEQFGITYLPIDFSTLTTIEKIDPSIDEKRAFVDSFRSLPERQGFWERLRGTFGQQIQQ